MTTHLNHSAPKAETNDQQGSGFEELVPSRYAVRVGEIDVLVISDGVLPLPTSTMSTNADPAARAAWFKDMFLGPDAFDWALNVLVVRSGEQVILVVLTLIDLSLAGNLLLIVLFSGYVYHSFGG